MTTFTIEIDLDNDAFDGNDQKILEVAEILRTIEKKIMNYDRLPTTMALYDSNG